jgi:DNA polymerase I-like protein with 3'-5' exonuclease and polymerase domains
MTDIMREHEAGMQVSIIGHNLKFDLKHMIRERPDVPWHKFDYYCTMHRHYRFTGHRDKFISLEDLAAVHCIVFTKTLDLGALLASGVKMEDIPRSDLEPYLVEDVKIVRQIHQYQETVDPAVDSSLVLPLARMELIGLPLDRTKTTTLMKKLAIQERDLQGRMQKALRSHLVWSDGSPIEDGDIKVNASRTLSFMITGEPQIGIKKGKRELAWQSGSGPVLEPHQIQTIWPGKKPNHLGYPMPEDKLKDVQTVLSGYKYLAWALEYRKVQKLMNTYVGPFLEKTKTLPTVHPKMHLTSTATGRLSSAEPNGQNLPEQARALFKSQHGTFMEIDFAQLEVCALAAITEDPTLINDLQAGEDVHYNSGRRVMGWKTKADMTDKARKIVKRVNFGLIYGGGAASLARQTGQDKKLVKSLIDSFYARYPGVGTWQEQFYQEVVNNLKPFDVKDGEQRYCSLVRSGPAGRYFHFVESESPAWLKRKTGRKYSFKPTETKNYPVQGFAGGDIVMLALVLLTHELWDYEHTDIRMTVHDSILVDTDLDESQIKTIMEDICTTIETVYQLPFELEFDITSGTHWR